MAGECRASPSPPPASSIAASAYPDTEPAAVAFAATRDDHRAGPLGQQPLDQRMAGVQLERGGLVGRFVPRGLQQFLHAVAGDSGRSEPSPEAV